MTRARRPLHSRARPVQREEAEQRIFAQWMALRFPRLKWHHSPNGGARSAVVGAKLKACGTSPGFPDIAIYAQPPRLLGITGFAAELKAPKPHASSVSTEQREWLEYLASQGWKTAVCYGAREACDLVEKLYGSP